MTIMNLSEVRTFLSRTISKTRYDAITRRNLPFNITTDDIVNLYIRQQGKCALTGLPLEFTRGGKFMNNANPNSCTMDRIDNKKGYELDNIQLTSWRANCYRGVIPLDEFKEFCKSVANHNKE